MRVRSRSEDAWQRLTHRLRQIIRKEDLRSGDAVGRPRRRVIMALVLGKSPARWAFGRALLRLTSRADGPPGDPFGLRWRLGRRLLESARPGLDGTTERR